ncbi:tyrosine-type recombinase/integrase [Lactobacillus sp. ESL0681]|uniref:tyrosine-type recombinase/integrase n=1 Tax=Lactobacillus sp. ESL0681 TaxID=2983211 RepID=UPI0023F9629D|nr:tyrosine-type recombinase/integrase [Lactobacillus sp. ESL0681]WEV39783.1 tyrosine-type recombinase/integrase [Lactobacillus sp. ESL0681]
MWAEFEEDSSVFDSKSSISFAQSLLDYCEEEHSAGRWSLSTYGDWKYTCRLVCKYFGETRIKDITELKIRAFSRNYIETHKAKVSKHSTIDRRLQHFRQYFSVLKEQGIVKINPVPKNPLRKFFRIEEFSVISEKYVFSSEEVIKIKQEIFCELKKLQVDFWVSRLAVLIALETGMRSQELQAIKWQQLVKEGDYPEFEINDAWNEKLHRLNGHLKSRPHGFYRKTLPLSEDLYNLLLCYKSSQDKILNNKGIVNGNNFILLNVRDYRRAEQGMPIVQTSMNEIIKKIAKKVGVQATSKEINMYTCRHTIATKLGNTPGMSYPWAASRLGHTTEMFLKTYVHVARDQSQYMMKLLSQTH